MCYFLLVRRTPATIGDISTTFMGVFYGAYLPSFWVRLRAVGTGFSTVEWAGVRAYFPWYPGWAPVPVPDTITQVGRSVGHWSRRSDENPWRIWCVCVCVGRAGGWGVSSLMCAHRVIAQPFFAPIASEGSREGLTEACALPHALWCWYTEKLLLASPPFLPLLTEARVAVKRGILDAQARRGLPLADWPIKHPSRPPSIPSPAPTYLLPPPSPLPSSPPRPGPPFH